MENQEKLAALGTQDTWRATRIPPQITRSKYKTWASYKQLEVKTCAQKTS